MTVGIGNDDILVFQSLNGEFEDLLYTFDLSYGCSLYRCRVSG